ncbi:hypothetical protein LZG00_10600 [Rhodobacteraceae bacterium LMO-12]|nr:hypothetical protein [Rhodobacteraceae bacterium LMO-JJ12]
MMARSAIPLVAAVCATLGAAPATAGPDRFSVLLGSKHIGASGFNELNPGLFASWEKGRIGYSLGAYMNSYERASVAATAHLGLFEWQNGALSAFGGLAWYPKDGHRFQTHLGSDIVGIGGLELRYGHVFLQFLPTDAGGASGLVTFGLTWAVGDTR